MKQLKIKEKDVNYPKRLLAIRGHPKLLYIEGNLELLKAEKAIAIVGARQCSKQGEEEAIEFAQYLARQGICIVSGMAIGIDKAAHIGAMKQIGKTIAVLPSGLKQIYPKENIELYKQILKNDGCIVSEYSENEEVNMQNFSKRNKIIAGLAQGVLVVEAKYRSGSSITAKHAKLQQKPVFCLPKDRYQKNGVGTNRLIQKGAILITKPEEILKYYGFETIQSKALKNVIHKKYNINQMHQDVYNAISTTPTNLNEIANKSKKDIAEIMTILTILELDGRIERLAGNNYKKL